MDETKNENTKTAWRRKPRKWSPKSRLGCKTCKIRRVKCDLSQPSCLKCRSTGRTCDGYSEVPLAFKAETEPAYYRETANRAETCEGYPHRATMSAYRPKHWHANHHGPIPQTLGPLMILPLSGSAQMDAMSFFEYTSIKHLNEYHPCESWRKTLMFCSQTVPSVRYAAMALASIYQGYLDREDRPQDNDALIYYNRAIQLLLNQEGGDSTETTAVTLLVCYLFTCFDHLAGNYVQAMKHLRGGVELSRNIDKIVPNTSTYDDAEPSGIHALISQVTRRIRRLDMQAVTFLTDWTPADVQDTFVSQISPSDRAFRSLEQAADHLHKLVARVMRLRWTEQQTPQSPSSAKDVLHAQLETWWSLFESMLQQGSFEETNSETYPLVSLLRLQHTMAWTLLSSHGPGREMEYDSFLPQFQQCVTLADHVAAAHVRYSGSLKPTFTPEIGILPVLYTIGVKCRHPMVRREVLSILRRQPIREAVWDSISAARVVERVIEIEEGGMTQSMDRIAAWQRVETVSWVQSANRVDIEYSFCTREGTHVESLMI